MELGLAQKEEKNYREAVKVEDSNLNDPMYVKFASCLSIRMFYLPISAPEK